jgi:hypothetical protein
MFVTVKNAYGAISEVPAPSNRVKAKRGIMPITRLREGTQIESTDGAYVTVEYAFRADLQLQAVGLEAIKIAKGAFGPDLPQHDTIVSKETRLFLSSPLIAGLVGHSGGLFPAGHLTIFQGVDPLPADDHVVVHHIMAATVCLINTNGLWVECYRPSQTNVPIRDALTHKELFRVFDTVPTENFDAAPPATALTARG